VTQKSLIALKNTQHKYVEFFILLICPSMAGRMAGADQLAICHDLGVRIKLQSTTAIYESDFEESHHRVALLSLLVLSAGHIALLAPGVGLEKQAVWFRRSRAHDVDGAKTSCPGVTDFLWSWADHRKRQANH
jgi:hypothetical protein